MSNVNIYEKNWIDLVFEGKNKSYGAYQLRQENEKTTLFALLGGVTLVFIGISVWLFLSSFVNNSYTKPIDENGTIITVSNYNPPKTETKKPETAKPHSESPVEPKINAPLVVAATPEVKENVPKNDTPTTTTQVTNSGTGNGIDTPSSGGGSTPTVTSVNTSGGNDLVKTNELDRLPEYPGGIKRFYEYVGNNFEKPDVDEHLSSMNVIMSFVIEKDGSMTEIKVLRSSDKSIEREAIRVLKSLRIKWAPGYKDGEKVRVLYTLPIKVAL
ncbi:MAG TPA: energy transducer TonB [Flavobacterium sp.]|uniref:energy transducer TonB n=1 Tax=Flavobacterium sp. TaxID=239 RepID=UPI002CD88340|nr:energy transducer TonB [Flavobacterium sp.]HNP33548.1 energy transducer TonB [Flavobacterium sp.]